MSPWEPKHLEAVFYASTAAHSCNKHLHMTRTLTAFLVLTAVVGLGGCESGQPSRLGQFDLEHDLFLAHFDSKTDVDDLHSIAGVATMLSDPRFEDVQFHVVAGAYGIQEGLYVPANELFDAAFGAEWTDAHGSFDQAVNEVSGLVVETLSAGGAVWIAEAGQSDFSAALLARAAQQLDGTDISSRFHVVQHSDWNESVTRPESLEYLRQNASYHKIADGNAVGNGTPGFRSEAPVRWRDHVMDPSLVTIWEMAIDIGNTYNGQEDRYLNEAIAQGGLDFSDVSEACWVFGFEGLADAEAFFKEFAAPAGER